MPIYENPLQVVADIIQTKMQLENGRVMLYNQQYDIPTDTDLMIIVGEEDSEVVATSTTTQNKDGVYTETNDAIIRSTVTIDVLSAGDVAQERKHEVILALNSIYSQQMQEANTMRIFQVPVQFVNASEAEASQMLNRYSLKFNIMYKKQMSNAVEYYDKFNKQVVGNN